MMQLKAAKVQNVWEGVEESVLMAAQGAHNPLFLKSNTGGWLLKPATGAYY